MKKLLSLLMLLGVLSQASLIAGGCGTGEEDQSYSSSYDDEDQNHLEENNLQPDDE